MTGSWCMTPYAALIDREVTDEEFRTLSAICRHITTSSDLAWPSTDLLARCRGISRRSVQRHLEALRKRGLIKDGEMVKTKAGRWVRSIRVLFPETTLDDVSETTLDDAFARSRTTRDVGGNDTGQIGNDTTAIENDTGMAPEVPTLKYQLEVPTRSTNVTTRQSRIVGGDGFDGEGDDTATQRLLSNYELLTIDIPRGELIAWIADAVEHHGAGAAEEALRRTSRASRYTIDALNEAHWQVLNEG